MRVKGIRYASSADYWNNYGFDVQHDVNTCLRVNVSYGQSVAIKMVDGYAVISVASDDLLDVVMAKASAPGKDMVVVDATTLDMHVPVDKIVYLFLPDIVFAINIDK